MKSSLGNDIFYGKRKGNEYKITRLCPKSIERKYEIKRINYRK